MQTQHYRALLAGAIMAVGLLGAAQPARAGLMDDLRRNASQARRNIQQRTERVRQRTRQRVEDTRRRAGQAVRRASEATRRHVGNARRNVRNTVRRESRRARETWQRAQSRIRETVRRTQQGARRLAERVGPTTEALRQRAVESGRRVARVLGDPEARRQFVNRAAPVANAIVLTGIRHVPIYDHETGRIVTFDTYCRQMAAEFGGGGSLGEDPVGTAYLMMVDGDFMTEGARIIPTDSGRYVTISEAQQMLAGGQSGVNRQQVSRAAEAAEQMQTAMRHGDAEAMQSASQEFAAVVGQLQHRDATARHLAFWGRLDEYTAGYASMSFGALHTILQDTDLTPAQSVLITSIAMGLALLIAVWIALKVVFAILGSLLRAVFRPRRQQAPPAAAAARA
jgi:hypothetical protein